jgi:DNA adenine methylase
VTRHRTTDGPFLKWAGGKRQLLDGFEDLWPGRIGRFVEPFLGSGAVFFRLAPRVRSALLNDVNAPLVELYVQVRDGVEPLVDELRSLAGPDANTRAVFDRRRDEYNALVDGPPSVRRAALLVYLNRTCFNGLYRVNGRGRFNVPFGRYAQPRILIDDRLRAASLALSKARIIASEDFATFLGRRCRKGDFVYLDPPYVPVSRTSYFTSYARGSFGPSDQERLADVMARLHSRGVRWMLSNSFTPLSRRLFVRGLLGRIGLPARRPYAIGLEARRAINSRGDARGPVREWVVRNYDS